MRYRYRLSLYDDSDLDKEIVDYLSRLPSSHRKQEMLRTFIRAGFSIVAKKQQDDIAYLDSLSDQQKSLLVRGMPYVDATTPRDSSATHKEPHEISGYENNKTPPQKEVSSKNYPHQNSKTESSVLKNMEEGSPDDPVDFMTLLQQ